MQQRPGTSGRRASKYRVVFIHCRGSADRAIAIVRCSYALARSRASALSGGTMSQDSLIDRWGRRRVIVLSGYPSPRESQGLNTDC